MNLIDKNQELADKTRHLLPETIEEMSNKLNVSGQELEDTIKNDIRFFPPGPNDKGIWRLNFKTTGQETPGTYFDVQDPILKSQEIWVLVKFFSVYESATFNVCNGFCYSVGCIFLSKSSAGF